MLCTTATQTVDPGVAALVCAARSSFRCGAATGAAPAPVAASRLIANPARAP
jgi:hypothetical protein